jgi:hypothetical protein
MDQVLLRLLHLLPGRRGDPICCTIQHSAVATRPEFYALSYCWGAPGDLERISIDGKASCIQSNLYDFLFTLSKRDARPALMDVMTSNHPYECFDVRDRVFGVLGLIADGSRFYKMIDYRITVEDLFFSILEHFQEYTGHLDNFLKQLSTLARRLKLDMMHCLEVAKGLKQEKFGFLGPFTASFSDRTGASWDSLSLGSRESKFKMKKTSQTLRRYVWNRMDLPGYQLSMFQQCLFTKAKFLPGDRLCLLGFNFWTTYTFIHGPPPEPS